MSPTATLYLSFFLGAVVRRTLPYAAVVYGFEVLGGQEWSGTFYVCLVLPYLACSLAAGRMIDRLSPGPVLHHATLAAMGLVAVLAVLLSSAAPHGVVMSVLLFGYGIAYTFAYPAYIAAIPAIVPPTLAARATVWVNVLALASLAYAPLVVGALRSFLDWPAVFVVLAALALAAAFATRALRLSRRSAPTDAATGARLGELITYCRGRRPLTALLLATGLFAGLIVGPLEVLLPHFAERTLGLGPLAAGMFIAVGGTGLVVGSIATLRLLGRGQAGRWLCATASLGAACVVAMTVVPPRAAIAAFFLSGVFGGAFSSLSIAATQAGAAEAFRGRIMGLFAPSADSSCTVMRLRKSAVDSPL